MSLQQMSISGAVLIIAVVVCRALAVNKLPKQTFLILWWISLARLLLPIRLPSMFSIYNLFGHPAAGSALEGAAVITAPRMPLMEAAVPIEGLDPLFLIWAAGAMACAAWFAIPYMHCIRQFSTSLPIKNAYTEQWLTEHGLKRRISIRQCGLTDTPLTYGIFHPVILLPKTLDWEDEEALGYTLMHEYVHIRHFDSAAKFLFALCLCVHWFNPFVWVMWVLVNRDMELACDEAVLQSYGIGSRAAYARALIGMEEKRAGFTPICSYFNKNAIEERICAIMKMRKLSVMGLCGAFALVLGVTTVFATSADNNGSLLTQSSTKVAVKNSVMVSDDTVMVQQKDGKNRFSIDGGKTWMSESEFVKSQPKVEWWTYEDYKAWLEKEKVQLKSLIGSGSKYMEDGIWIEWNEKSVNEAIKLYESILEDIKNGVKVSKSVNGDDSLVLVQGKAPEAEQKTDYAVSSSKDADSATGVEIAEAMKDSDDSTGVEIAEAMEAQD